MNQMDRKTKGRIAASAIVLTLRRYPGVNAYEIPEQNDENHWDINVDLQMGSGVAGMKVQAKWLSEHNTKIAINHLDDGIARLSVESSGSRVTHSTTPSSV
jgi:hypothetical protein